MLRLPLKMRVGGSTSPNWTATSEKFDYRSLANGSVKILASWESENIVTVHIPMLQEIATDGGKSSGKVRCHRLIKDALVGAFAEIETRPKLRQLVLFWSGGFVPRHIGRNPSRPLSPHSWGVAFDLNDEWNPWGKLGAKKGEKRKRR